MDKQLDNGHMLGIIIYIIYLAYSFRGNKMIKNKNDYNYYKKYLIKLLKNGYIFSIEEKT